MKKYTDIMVDLETLDTSPTSVVLSIGAVAFNLAEEGKIDDNGFYTVLEIEPQLAAGSTVSTSTLQFWMKQDEQARMAIAAPTSIMAPDNAMGEFIDFVATAAAQGVHVWSNGADFDIPIILRMMRTYDYKAPWEFWNHRCFRTWKNLPGANKAKKPDNLAAHNALSDAHAQALHAQYIYSEVFTNRGKK